ncbi:MAG: hypothetical protein ACKV2V_17625, partial [Blastocatellia bacterium]
MQTGKQPAQIGSHFFSIHRFSHTAILLFMLAILLAAVRHGGVTHAEPGGQIVAVNAASYTSPLAPGSIAAAFGTQLAARAESAPSLPLPDNLTGTAVRLVDSQGAERRAPLFFVSPGQVNYLVPENMPAGATQIIVTNGDTVVARGEFQVAACSPAIFTALSSGRGAPVALSTYDGVSYESVVNPDMSARTVELGSVWKPNYLVLFGTGLRHATNPRIRLGGVDLTPLYVGPQNSFAGLDQINLRIPSNTRGGLTDLTISADGMTSNIVQLKLAGEAAAAANDLAIADVQRVMVQAVAKAQQLGARATVAVSDREGNVLGVFRMTSAAATTRIGYFNAQNQASKPASSLVGGPTGGLQNVDVPASFAAISKAGTAAFFSTQGNAFTTRTASFIVQEHFPAGVDFTAGGPLFGVQFSQLPCSDVKKPNLPLGLSADPGGVPLYVNGVAAGGVGIEVDGIYSADLNPMDNDTPAEEVIAVAASLG